MNSAKVQPVWIVEAKVGRQRSIADVFRKLGLFSARLFSSCDEVLEALRRERPGLLLVEGAIDNAVRRKLKRIQAASPDTNVMLLASFEDMSMDGRWSDSISGRTLEKNNTPLAAANVYGLSAREQQILHLMVKGLINKEIAETLSISYFTVENHQRKIYEKLRVHTRTAAVAKALLEKIFPT